MCIRDSQSSSLCPRHHQTGLPGGRGLRPAPPPGFLAAHSNWPSDPFRCRMVVQATADLRYFGGTCHSASRQNPPVRPLKDSRPYRGCLAPAFFLASESDLLLRRQASQRDVISSPCFFLRFASPCCIAFGTVCSQVFPFPWGKRNTSQNPVSGSFLYCRHSGNCSIDGHKRVSQYDLRISPFSMLKYPKGGPLKLCNKKQFFRSSAVTFLSLIHI